MRTNKGMVALSTPFDNSTNGFTATEVQSAIEEAKNTAIARARFLASGGFDGNASTGRYLEFNSNVDSNNTGLVFPRAGIIYEVSYAHQANATISWNVQRKTPGPVTTLYNFSLTASRIYTATGLSISFSAGDEWQIVCASGSCSRPIIYLWGIFN